MKSESHIISTLYYFYEFSYRRICIISCDWKPKIINIQNPKFLTDDTCIDMENNWSCLTL